MMSCGQHSWALSVPSLAQITLREPHHRLFLGVMPPSHSKKPCPLACPLAHHVLDDLVLAVLTLHLEQVVAEVKEVEAPLLAQQHDDGAASPVQPVPETLPVGVGDSMG